MGDMQQFDLMTLSFAQMQQIKKQMEEVRLLVDFSFLPQSCSTSIMSRSLRGFRLRIPS